MTWIGRDNEGNIRAQQETEPASDFLGLTWTEETDYESPDQLSVFIANGRHDIDKQAPFNKWYTFFLTKNEIEDPITRDVIQSDYKNNEDVTAISEFISYTRETSGVVPNDTYELTRKIDVHYFREDGTFLHRDLPPQVLSEKKRIDIDIQARKSVIEAVRTDAGVFIQDIVNREVAAGNILLQNAQDFGEKTSDKFLEMFADDHISVTITAYREDRRNAPLIQALNDYPRNDLRDMDLQPLYSNMYLDAINEEILQFIINKVDVQFYTTV